MAVLSEVVWFQGLSIDICSILLIKTIPDKQLEVFYPDTVKCHILPEKKKEKRDGKEGKYEICSSSFIFLPLYIFKTQSQLPKYQTLCEISGQLKNCNSD